MGGVGDEHRSVEKKRQKEHCNKKVMALSGGRGKPACTYCASTVYIPTVSIN